MAKHQFGLVGKNISYSFSKAHFTKKFEELNLFDYSYENLDIQDITEFPNFIKNNANLKGLNVTIPYKYDVIKYLDSIEESAALIESVNTIVRRDGLLKGYNTDYIGFLNSIKIHLTKKHKKAIILGSGGASKAIIHALKKLEITK